MARHDGAIKLQSCEARKSQTPLPGPPFPSDSFIPQNGTIINGEVRYCFTQQITRTCDIGVTLVTVWIAFGGKRLESDMLSRAPSFILGGSPNRL